MADAERYSAGVWFLAGLACLNLVAYSLVGFHGYDDPRFILLTTFPLFALCLHAVETWPGLRGALRGTGPGEARAPGAPGDSARPDTAATGKRLHRGRGLLVGLLAAAAVAQGAAAFAVMIRKVPAVTIAGTPVRVLPRALLRYPPAEYDRLLGELARYADGPGEAVATGMPWLVHFFAGGRPTALLPVDLTPETFPEYLARYRVRTVVLDPASLGQERFLRYRGMIEILAAAGDGAVWQSGSFVFYRRDGPGAAVPGEASREVPPGPARTRIPRSIDLLEAAAFRHEP